MIAWVIFLFLAICFGAAAILGAPYLPLWGNDADSLLDLAGLRAGDKVLDLGAGDGKLLKAAAKRGIYGEGWEINPVIYIIAKLNCRPYRKYITLHLDDYWHVKLPPADAIYVFLIDRYMRRLDRKLSTEITQPTPVVSYVFEIPGRTAVRTTKNSYRYDYPIQNSR